MPNLGFFGSLYASAWEMVDKPKWVISMTSNCVEGADVMEPPHGLSLPLLASLEKYV